MVPQSRRRGAARSGPCSAGNARSMTSGGFGGSLRRHLLSREQRPRRVPSECACDGRRFAQSGARSNPSSIALSRPPGGSGAAGRTRGGRSSGSPAHDRNLAAGLPLETAQPSIGVARASCMDRSLRRTVDDDRGASEQSSSPSAIVDHLQRGIGPTILDRRDVWPGDADRLASSLDSSMVGTTGVMRSGVDMVLLVDVPTPRPGHRRRRRRVRQPACAAGLTG